MRIAVLLLGAFAALTAADGVRAAPAAVLQIDFARAVALTLATSPDLQASNAAVRAARGAEQAAQSARWPRLAASLDAMRSNDPLAVFGAKLSQRQATFADFGAAQYTGPGSLNVTPTALDYPDAYNNFDTRIEIDWPLYAGGRMSAAIRGAQAALHAARSGDLAARQAVIFDVLQAYEGVRAARAETAVAARSVAAAGAYLASARKRYAQGTAIKSDVLTAQVSYDQARLQQRNADDALATARDKLATLLGLPPGTGFALGPAAEPRMPRASLVQLQGDAVAHNPVLLELRQRVAARRAALAAQQAAYRPRVSLTAQRDWNDRTPGFGGASYTVAGVVSWDLFDFGARRGAVEQAHGEADAARARAAAYAQGLHLQIDRDWRAARAAVDQVRVGEASVAEATEARRILELRFNQGLATISELLDAQARLDGAAAGLVAARYDLRIRRAAVLLDLGRLDLSEFGRPAREPASAASAGASLALDR